jgi:DNA-binding CsgD family transcriptional regulator
MFWYNKHTMFLWQRLSHWLGLRQAPSSHPLELSRGLQTSLSTLARHAGQPEDELAEAVFASGLDAYYAQGLFWNAWENLTPRERDITALTCLGYTNRQMASRLDISVETVKTHVANTLRKFDLHSKADLRVSLAGWDFSAWRE